MLTSFALECKARDVWREVLREGHKFRATHSFQMVRVETGCTGKLFRRANEKWQRADGEEGTLCSVHCQLNGTLFMSRQRGWKVTTIHEHMPLRSGVQCRSVLQQERVDMVGYRIRIVLEHEAKR